MPFVCLTSANLYFMWVNLCFTSAIYFVELQKKRAKCLRNKSKSSSYIQSKEKSHRRKLANKNWEDNSIRSCELEGL